MFEEHRRRALIRGEPTWIPPEQKQDVAEAIRADRAASTCWDCPHKIDGCKYADMVERLPMWANGQGKCLQFAEQRLSCIGWINPADGEPMIVPKTGIDAIRKALRGKR